MKFNFGSFSQDPHTGEYSYTPPPKNPRRARKALSKGKSLLIALLVTLVFGFVYFYFSLPAINIHSSDLYVFIILLCAVFGACELLLTGAQASSVREWVGTARKRAAVPFYVVCLALAVAIVGTVIGWRVFRARDYASLLPIENGDFASEVSEISFDQIPMLDSASANVLATRRLGELADLVSQFEVNSESYQINYHDRPVRVTYLNYGDFFKWWNNQRDGIPAYIVIDMVTQEVTVERLEEGIRYSPSEYFFRDIDRYLRFKYPTKMFSDVNFEVNEEGEPYWVATGRHQARGPLRRRGRHRRRAGQRRHRGERVSGHRGCPHLGGPRVHPPSSYSSSTTTTASITAASGTACSARAAVPRPRRTTTI